MVTSDFAKKFDDVTDEEWNEIYAIRAKHGDLYSNSIYDGASLKAKTIISRNQEAAVKAFLERGCDEGDVVRYMDDERDIVYPRSPKKPDPDLECIESSGLRGTFEVKSYHYTTAPDLRLCFGVYLDDPKIKTGEDVLNAIWKYDFHDADAVLFVTPDCTKCCMVTRNSLSLDVRPENQPKIGANGKSKVIFYAKRGSWMDL